MCRQDGQVIHPRRRRAVQACRVRRPAAMRAHSSGARAPLRYSCGRVWPPRGATHPRGQCVPSGLLLATAVADASEIVRTCEGC
jgi:hypothetical protein